MINNVQAINEFPPGVARYLREQASKPFNIDALKADRDRILAEFPDLYFERGLALVTGTGWNGLDIGGESKGKIPFSELYSFTLQGGVSGHDGYIEVLEFPGEVGVLVFNGRNHRYQMQQGEPLTPLVAIPYLSQLTGTLILTQGVGGLHAKPGSYVVVADHVGTESLNLHPGAHESRLFKDEFTKCGLLYDPELRRMALEVFNELGLDASEGIYRFWESKHFQTPAEVELEKAKRAKFVDSRGEIIEAGLAVIGKSCVIDTIYANGLLNPPKVLSLCLVTNVAQPLPIPGSAGGPDHLLHKQVGAEAKEESEEAIRRIIRRVLNI